MVAALTIVFMTTACGASKASPSTRPGPNAGVVFAPNGAPTGADGATPRAALSAYLNALVARDWKLAHALTCADLADQFSAGALKKEFVQGVERAGKLTSFTISGVREGSGTQAGSAAAKYALKYEHATAQLTASLETEGTQWRICHFETTNGTGAFATTLAPVPTSTSLPAP